MKVVSRGALVLVLLSASSGLAGSGKYSIKTSTKAPPAALAEPVKQLLSDQVVELYEGGKLAAEVWFCKAIPGQAPADKAKKEVGYRDLKETSLFGAVKLHREWGDYRKQKVKAGVYTLRLGFQPQDGDHMGTAPHPEFLLLTAAKLDPKAETLPIKTLIERSATSINTSHPAVLLLYPNAKPGEKIELAGKANDTWLLNLKRPVTTDNNGTAELGIGFAIVGHTAE